MTQSRKLKKGVYSTCDMESEDIDFTNHTTVFDDDVGIEDPDDGDEISDYPKRRKILINTLQDC